MVATRVEFSEQPSIVDMSSQISVSILNLPRDGIAGVKPNQARKRGARQRGKRRPNGSPLEWVTIQTTELAPSSAARMGAVRFLPPTVFPEHKAELPVISNPLEIRGPVTRTRQSEPSPRLDKPPLSAHTLLHSKRPSTDLLETIEPSLIEHSEPLKAKGRPSPQLQMSPKSFHGRSLVSIGSDELALDSIYTVGSEFRAEVAARVELDAHHIASSSSGNEPSPPKWDHAMKELGDYTVDLYTEFDALSPDGSTAVASPTTAPTDIASELYVGSHSASCLSETWRPAATAIQRTQATPERPAPAIGRAQAYGDATSASIWHLPRVAVSAPLPSHLHRRVRPIEQMVTTSSRIYDEYGDCFASEGSTERALRWRPNLYKCSVRGCKHSCIGIATLNRLITHVFASHFDVPNLQCEFCLKYYSRKDSLVRHIRLKHRNQQEEAQIDKSDLVAWHKAKELFNASYDSIMYESQLELEYHETRSKPRLKSL